MGFRKRKYVTSELIGYSGKQSVITARSSWEIKVIEILQRLSFIKKIEGWNSEESVFKYPKRIDGGIEHRYFMDYTIFKNNGDVIFVEVKPFSQTIKPSFKKNMNEKQKINYDKNLATYITNMDKWSAVVKWCEHNNAKQSNIKFSFQIWTEKPKSISQERFFEKNKQTCCFPVYHNIKV